MVSCVSVVIPWGKCDGRLDRCLTSVLGQIGVQVEIFVIANGGVSKTDFELMRERFGGYESINWHFYSDVSNANIARNIGVSFSRFEFIAFIDSDDWWDDVHLISSLDALAESGASLVYSGMNIFSSDGVRKIFASDYSSFGGIENYLLLYFPAPTPSFVGRRFAVKNTRWDESLSRHQDYDFISRLEKNFALTHKLDITVNVDWIESRARYINKDCLKVMRSWVGLASAKLIFRHVLVISKSSLRSGNFRFVFRAIAFLIWRL